MKKIYLLLFSLLLITGKAVWSQCTNTTAFGTATINASGTAVTISTCSFAGEYSTINGAVNGQTLRFTSSVATDFITIHSGTSNGPVVASGVTPLVFANTFTGTLFAHWNTSAACGSQGTCRTTTVQCTSCVPPPPPVNDLCTGALPIACGQTIAGSTATGATIDAGAGTCVTALNTAPGVWYTFAGDGSSTTLSLCGSGYDTKIGVFSGSCAGLTCVTGNDDFAGCGVGSQVTFTANLGTTYYVLVTGFGTNSGAFTLNRSCVFPCTGVPSPGSISGPAGTICAGTNVTLTLGGFTTGVTGISFQWKSSPTAGGPYTNIAGATNSTFTGPAGPNRFYVCTVTCANGGGNATTAEFALNVNRPQHTNVLANPNTGCAPFTTNITGTVSGGVTTGGSGVLASSGTINLAIPDNTPAGINTTLTVPATNFPAAADLKVRVNLSHSWSGDLRFTLTSPCGTTFLFDRLGVPASGVGNSDNFGTNNTTTPPAATYTFDLAGATVLPETTGGAGFIAAGTYRPSDVNGAAHNWAGVTFPCAGGGTWTLNMSDNAALDVGSLVDWAIIGPTTGNYIHSLSGPGTIVQNPASGPNNSNGSFTVSNLPAGTHNFTFTSTDVTGCSVSSPVSVTVNPTPVVNVSPTAPVICAGSIQQLTYSVTPPITQTFASGAINLAIPDNNATGVTTAAIAIPAGVNLAAANNLRVRINARHSWVGDLVFRLTSPCGTTFLFDRPGVPPSTVGNSDNLGTATGTTPPPGVYTFDLAAATILPETTGGTGFIAPGAYRPSNTAGTAHNWAGLTFPCAATGNWTLTISDNAAGDVGALVDWAILSDVSNPVVITPITDVYTDAAATVPYVAGTPVTTVWVKPPTTTTYTATATVAGCTSAPLNVTVTVNQLPAITAQPAALAAPICPGFNVTYTVGATGAGLTYQWQLSTDGGTTYNNIINNPPYSGATTNALTITNVTTAMTNYRYRVIVSGTCAPSVTSNPVILVVSTPPTITTPPANVTICAGANASFSVVAAGIPAPNIYQWQVSIDGGATWTNLTTGGSFTPTFTITGATTALNNNRYRCIVTNSCGQTVTSASATLVVNAVPIVAVTSLIGTRICISDTLVPLSGTPVGGSWSGTGVSGFNFVPGVTAVGTYTLTYTFTNAAGCTSTATTVAKVEDCAERIRLLSENGVLLYPNPNSGQFFIKMNSTLYNYLGVRVYNMAGQVVNGTITNDAVASPTYSGLVYGRVIPMDLTNLPSGTYMVKVFYDDGIRTSEKGFLVVINK
ncbi:MAG: T9SS type A sorting domain-containing protein [Bacteroidetes bacterium]|nr:T9SS type A sorting domain-containing protein [Bacteroidota bacterium]